ncbi:MAG TPA: DUF2203 family protein [Planctomycetes bacterium]|nr:DUF2203 family protein [Planctomycetota bacterium]HIK62191.1 DUF2203 family protein [Planctomycetota bacterium]
MKRAYDRDRARQLIPLLGSITQEISERVHEALIIQGRLVKLEGNPASDEFMNLKAKLAIHRRELRQSAKELSRLGCVIDAEDPGQIRIPGSDGEFEHGFQFDSDSHSLRRVETGVNIA